MRNLDCHIQQDMLNIFKLNSRCEILSLLPANIHPSWNTFLASDIFGMLDTVEKSIGDSFNPARDKVLRFLTTDLDAMKIVVLGQDPYPEAGVATGRAFEVGTLRSWDKPFRQVSLKNIVRLIYKAKNGIEKYEDIPTFSKIVAEMQTGLFRMAEPPVLFESLERQGVLFLNTCFTVCPGQPLSHRDVWQPFTEHLIPYISHRNQELVWFLWGKSALSYQPFIFKGRFYESRHPMMCSGAYSDDFLKCSCIEDTLKIVNWTGV